MKINNQELKTLKERVLQANLKLAKAKLSVLTWGNVSELSADRSYFVIKPSGISYETMQADDMVIIEMATGKTQSKNRPSTDAPTHYHLYQQFANLKSIMHTHSPYATAFAQAAKEIKAFGTTHADNIYGSLPLTRALKKEEMEKAYELNTGKVIVETIKNRNYEIEHLPGILVRFHGLFCWSLKNALKVVELGIALEEIAKMAYLTLNINPQSSNLPQGMLDVHYYRKHGKNAYYGQGDEDETDEKD